MKAITLWQPWASLVLVGAKPYEFRGWKPPRSLIGKRIAIHAGARKARFAEMVDLMDRIELGDPNQNPCLHPEPARQLLRRALAALKQPDPDSLFPESSIEPFTLPLACILCTAVLGVPKQGDLCAQEFGFASNDSDRNQNFNWGWPLTQVEPLVPPVEARGAQGFWEWP